MNAANHSVLDLDNEFLLEAADISRRLRKYVFLPFVLIGTFVSFMHVLLLLDGYSMTSAYQKSVVPATVISALLWWWSRKPRRMLFLFAGVFLVCLGLLVGSGLIYALLWEKVWSIPTTLTKHLGSFFEVVWASIVFLGTWVFGMKCLTVWRALKSISDPQFHTAIAEAREKTRLRQAELSTDRDKGES